MRLGGLRGAVDDRSTKARIRDAAIACFAEYGLSGTTARKVAAAAGVTAGSVIHHFGSMNGLREACDEHVTSLIKAGKTQALAAGPGIDPLAALRGNEAGPLVAYLAQVLTDDSPALARLVDGLVADAEEYMQRGVESGMLKPSTDPHGRAAVLTLWSLGSVVLNAHVRRIFGVDLTDPQLGADPNFNAYAGPVLDIVGDGVLTDAFMETLREAFSGDDPDPPENPPPPSTLASQTPPTEEGSS